METSDKIPQWSEVEAKETGAREYRLVENRIVHLGTIYQKPPERCGKVGEETVPPFIWTARVAHDCVLYPGDFPKGQGYEEKEISRVIEGKAHTFEEAKLIVETLLVNTRTLEIIFLPLDSRLRDLYKVTEAALCYRGPARTGRQHGADADEA